MMTRIFRQRMNPIVQSTKRVDFIMKPLVVILISIVLIILFILTRKLFFIFRFDGNLRICLKLLFIKKEVYIPILYRPKEVESDTASHNVNTKKENKISKENNPDTKEKLPFPGIKNALIFFKNSLGDIFGKVVKYFRLEKLDFRAVAAWSDASTAAELYGVFCTVGAALHQFSLKAKKIRENMIYVEVIPDFNAESPDVYTHMIFSINVWKLLMIAGKALSIWQSYKKLSISVSKTNNNDSESDSSLSVQQTTK